MINWLKIARRALLLEDHLVNTQFVPKMLTKLIVWFQKSRRLSVASVMDSELAPYHVVSVRLLAKNTINWLNKIRQILLLEVLLENTVCVQKMPRKPIFWFQAKVGQGNTRLPN